MKNNPKLMIILGVIAALILFGFIWSGAKSSNGSGKTVSKGQQHAAFDVASGDTNNEVLQSIVAKQKALEKQNQKLIDENTKLQHLNASKTQQALTEAQNALTQKINATRTALENQFQSELNRVKGDIRSKPVSRSGSGLEYPLSGGTAQSNSASRVITEVPDLTVIPKHSGRDNLAVDSAAPVLPSDNDNNSNKPDTVTPYYTIPDGATAANAVLLSPLVGEVPVSGHLVSPAFPFKSMLSPKDAQNMFTANGVPLPGGISGVVLQGYSVGDMSLGCARAYVMKILFVYDDGHYEVYPIDKDNGGNSTNATEVYPKNSIGYLSDAYNNPCLSGQYLTDAPKVIASLAGLGGIEGGGGAIAQAQTQTMSSFGNGASSTSSVLTGSLGKYMAGIAVGDASKAALDWYKSRVADIFDAVFVPSTLNGAPRELIFNVTKTIPIDLNQQGRKLSYANSSQMSATDNSFE